MNIQKYDGAIPLGYDLLQEDQINTSVFTPNHNGPNLKEMLPIEKITLVARKARTSLLRVAKLYRPRFIVREKDGKREIYISRIKPTKYFLNFKWFNLRN